MQTIQSILILIHVAINFRRVGRSINSSKFLPKCLQTRKDHNLFNSDGQVYLEELLQIICIDRFHLSFQTKSRMLDKKLT